MEQEYKTIEIWYPYQGGGEMKEFPYDEHNEMPPHTEDSKLVNVVNR